MTKIKVIKNLGFTLVELLVVISIIGFLIVSSVARFNIVRMNTRDTVRAGNIATIKRALAMYLNDSANGYPFSTGDCLKAGSGVGASLIQAKVLLVVPTDPLWPAVGPSDIGTGANIGAAVNPSSNFCYYYYSNASDQYKISYFLESNSNAGDAKINVTTQ